MVDEIREHEGGFGAPENIIPDPTVTVEKITGIRRERFKPKSVAIDVNRKLEENRIKK